MVPTHARDRRRLALRETILEAAQTIVREDGLAALTIRRLAEAIDYSPAALYAHFESREALLAALCREGLTALRVALEAAGAGVPEPRVRLLALARGYVRFALERPDTYRLIFMENAALTKGVFESFESDDAARALGLLVAPFAELRAAKVLRKSANPARLADLVWIVAHGIASLRLSCPALPSTDDDTLVSIAIDAILDAWQTRTRIP